MLIAEPGSFTTSGHGWNLDHFCQAVDVFDVEDHLILDFRVLLTDHVIEYLTHLGIKHRGIDPDLCAILLTWKIHSLILLPGNNRSPLPENQRLRPTAAIKLNFCANHCRAGADIGSQETGSRKQHTVTGIGVIAHRTNHLRAAGRDADIDRIPVGD